MDHQQDRMSDPDAPLATPPRSSLKSRVLWPLMFVMVGVASWSVFNYTAKGSEGGGAGAGTGVLEGWETALKPAFARAEAEGKPLLVYFTADWCPPCQDFKSRVLTQASVSAEVQDRVVPVLLDADTLGLPGREAELRLAEFLRVQTIPDMYMFSAEGRPMSRYQYDVMAKEPVADFTGWLAAQAVAAAPAPATQPGE